MLNGMDNLPQYPTPQTMVNANGQPLGNGGGFPASNKANPYAHAQPGMYAGGSSLHGMGKPIMKMTVEEVVSQVPDLMKALSINPAALSAFASFGESSRHKPKMPAMPIIPQTRGLGFNGFTDIIDDNEAYTYMQATNMVTHAGQEAEHQFHAELIPASDTGNSLSVKGFYHAMRIGASLVSQAAVYVHKEADGTEKTYENPRLTVEMHKRGRHPDYACIKTILESSNYPPVLRRFWIIDARELDPDYALIVISAEEGENAVAAKQFADQVYCSYHDEERTWLDKVWFDKKYGWTK